MLSDEDLVSGSTLQAKATDNWYNTGNIGDPTNANAKRDLGSGRGSNVWDYFFEDKDPRPKDTGDKGNDGTD